MPHRRIAFEKIVFATVLMALAMLPPVLPLFNKPVLLAGIPLLYAWTGLCWLLYIVVLARLSKQLFGSQ